MSLTDRQCSRGTPVSHTNKTDSHDIIEMLLKVALNIKTLTLSLIVIVLDINQDMSHKCVLSLTHCMHYNGRRRVSFILWNITIWLNSYILLNTCLFINGKIKRTVFVDREKTSKITTHLRINVNLITHLI